MWRKVLEGNAGAIQESARDLDSMDLDHQTENTSWYVHFNGQMDFKACVEKS
jgi:hypothetical protein